MIGGSALPPFLVVAGFGVNIVACFAYHVEVVAVYGAD